MSSEDSTVVWRPLTQCVHCGVEHPRMTVIPLAEDSDAWRAIAREHRADCEWVTTRAGRLGTNATGRRR